MATKIFTPAMLRGAGTRGVPEIAAGSSFSNTYSMAFDGVDEYVEVTGFTTSGNDLTISFWAKLPNLGSGAGYILAGNSNNVIYYNLNEIMYAKVNGTTAYIVTNSGGVPNVFNNNWHHFAITKATSTLKFWFNGVSYTNAGSGGTGGFTLSHIGAYITGASGVNGNLDEVAIWNSDQTSNMATIYNSGVPGDLSSLSPLGWWRMGDKASWDGTDWTLTDQGSGGNDGKSDNMEEADRSSSIPS